MDRFRHRLVVALLTAGLCWACQPVACNALRFPVPGRPVANIVAPAYSDEKARDQKGEARLVMERLGIKPGVRVADIGAGEGYYTVRLARRLGSSAAIYAQDVQPRYLEALEARLKREKIPQVILVRGAPRDPKLPPNSIDLALLAHMYHEIENPYEFMYRLHPSLAQNARVAVIEVDRPTQNHGTPPALLRCELRALGYVEVDFMLLSPADGYLAVYAPPAGLLPVSEIKPCEQ